MHVHVFDSVMLKVGEKGVGKREKGKFKVIVESRQLGRGMWL